MSVETSKYFEKTTEEGIVSSASNWADNINHLVIWIEFEDTHAFAKFYADEKLHQLASEFAKLVDNMLIRILRPDISV